MTLAPQALASLTEDQLSLLFDDAHTAHSFTDEEVSQELADQVYELIKWAPTSMNNQPLRITWVRSQEARGALVDAMSDGNKDKTAAAPLVAILSADSNWFEHFGTFAPWAEGRKTFFEENPQAAEKMANNNAHIQAGYFILAVRALGLAVGPMGGFDAAKIDEHFNADNGHKAFLVVNVGHPAHDAFRPRGGRLEPQVAVRTL